MRKKKVKCINLFISIKKYINNTDYLFDIFKYSERCYKICTIAKVLNYI